MPWWPICRGWAGCEAGADVDFLGIDRNLLRGILLLVLMFGFLGIWAWAWSSKRKKTFEDASRLPLEEDEGEVPLDNADSVARKE